MSKSIVPYEIFTAKGKLILKKRDTKTIGNYVYEPKCFECCKDISPETKYLQWNIATRLHINCAQPYLKKNSLKLEKRLRLIKKNIKILESKDFKNYIFAEEL